jgi:acyl CoA:acetate/3-ketoacid CoA transferase beta subunit
MDLVTVTGAKRVIVSMQHAAKGKSKIDAEMHVAAHLRALDRSRGH